MKYTEKQRLIVALCRKYRNTEIKFEDGWFFVTANGTLMSFYDDDYTLSEIEEFLSENAIIKSKSAPRKKGVPKKKVVFYLDKETQKKLNDLGTSKSLNITKAIDILWNARMSNLSGFQLINFLTRNFDFSRDELTLALQVKEREEESRTEAERLGDLWGELEQARMNRKSICGGCRFHSECNKDYHEQCDDYERK